MNGLKNSLIVLLVVASWLTACDDSESPAPDNGKPDTETIALTIPEKWVIQGSAAYKSLEFLENDVYILEKYSTSSGGRLTAEAVEILSGQYEVSSDGKIITLQGFGTLTLTAGAEGAITFELTPDHSSESIVLTAEKQDEIPASANTIALSRTWIPTGETACTDCEAGTWDEQLENTGRKMEVTFTQNGTVLTAFQEVSCSTDPAGTESCTLGEIEYTMFNWKWEDSSETSIILSQGSESQSREISSLTDASVVFSPNFLGDIIQMKAK